MYILEKVKPADLSRIQVKKQDKIIELTGSRFDPAKAFEVIKKETKDFKEQNEKAKEADALFAELLKQNGIKVQPHQGGEKAEQNRVRIREQERARAIQILELEMQLAA
ncbi:hypothetical protein GCM10009122_22810 [Fulvivirga kasyanovii]|uniref:Uncharacterized protein n=1 Tax=Fulvivirga kasyanovii TaxID=396812 RepID=A0ABW9RQ70_9BACT|nr:hypothetical protein [Fulvivirga kasyanovii]MTI26303.1 hypothetical protein [Fulvivirga kasyanovii]